MGDVRKIGSWNVRTLYEKGKYENLVKEAGTKEIDILGVCEHRWAETGTINGETHTFIYSGGNRHEHGVGILLNKKLTKYVKGKWLVSPRNMLIKLNAQPFDIAIIQTYAPTTSYSDEDIEAHYDEIEMMLKEVASTDVLVVMGDFNAKVGKGKEEDIIGEFGLGERNERGDRLAHFCIENDLSVVNTFPQKPARKL